MLEIHVEKSAINTEALDAELRTTLREVVIGVGSANEEAIVYLTDEATPEQQEQARTIVEAHDPTQLTPEQQARAQRQQELEELRQANTNLLDLNAYDGESEAIRQLAQKLAWLELEFRVRQGE